MTGWKGEFYPCNAVIGNLSFANLMGAEIIP